MTVIDVLSVCSAAACSKARILLVLYKAQPAEGVLPVPHLGMNLAIVFHLLVHATGAFAVLVAIG